MEPYKKPKKSSILIPPKAWDHNFEPKKNG